MTYYKLNKWSKKHPPFISTYSSYVASLVEGVYQIVKMFTGKTVLNGFGNVPPLKIWLEFYNNDSFFGIETVQALQSEVEIPELAQENVTLFTAFAEKLDEKEENKDESYITDAKNQLDACLKAADDLLKQSLDEMKADSERPISDKDKLSFELSETKFLFFVYVPCFLFYGKLPHQLFRQAQGGCLESIGSLLRIDPSVLGDPSIFKHFHIASKNENQTVFNDMLYNMQNPPKERTTFQRIKYKFAGLISLAAELYSYRLTAPEIERLFKALAEDLNRPELELELLDTKTEPVRDESIAQRIRREKQFCKELTNPYMK